MLISITEMNDLSRGWVFHTQVANVLGSDAVVAKCSNVRDGESIGQSVLCWRTAVGLSDFY